MSKTEAKQSWEEAELPILCETCLGDNLYLRMTREKFAKACKVCERPFTNFRWNPGAGMRFKTTQVCQTCAKLKNVCQTCILDLQYNLPVQVRDTLAGNKNVLPTSNINRQYFIQNVEIGSINAPVSYPPIRSLSEGESAHSSADTPVPSGSVSTSLKAPDSRDLEKIARREPNYKRNLPHICSFWQKGECKRGEECPYRHEIDTRTLNKQNVKDRFFGENDPVANKMLKTFKSKSSVDNKDKSITTVFVSGLQDSVAESDIRDVFYSFGEIRSITMVYKSNCAFVSFKSRTAAEAAIAGTAQGITIKNLKLKVQWGKPKSQGPRIDKVLYPSMTGVPLDS